MTWAGLLQVLLMGAFGSLFLNTCKSHEHTAAKVVGAESETWVKGVASQVSVAPVAMRELHGKLTTNGRVAYDDSQVAHVFSAVTGRITHIHAQPGDHVTRGAKLATIQSPDVGVASADVDKAHAVSFAAEADFKRKQALFKAGAVAQRDLEAAVDTYEVALAELRRAEEKYALFGGGAYDPNIVRGSYELGAPIAGEVVSRFVNPGMEIIGQYQGGSASELFTVANLKSVWVVADIYEADVGRVVAGMNVALRVEAYPDQVFTGAVEWVSDMLDPTARTARLRCAIPNPDGLLKPDMFAAVTIASRGHMVLTVPRQSVTRLGEKTVVYVQTGQNDAGDRRFMRRPVIVDEAEEGGDLPVLHGLNAGDTVVTQGVDYLVGKI